MAATRKPPFRWRLGAGIGIALCVGYLVRSLQEEPAHRMGFGLADFEDEAGDGSFSEVVRLKDVLRELRVQFLLDLHLWKRSRNPPRPVESGLFPPLEARDLRILERLEEGRREFSETAEAMSITHAMLGFFAMRGADDRWIEEYLALLYRHPTSPLIAAYADDARNRALKMGREAEVETAFQHLDAIPKTFLLRPW